MATVTIQSTGKERFWRGHMEGWQQGSLSQRQYCERHGLALSTFTLWRRRLQTAGAAPSRSGVEIVPLRAFVCAAESPVVLVLGQGQYRLELQSGFQAETLRAVVSALGGC
jgi:hypothetical protein